MTTFWEIAADSVDHMFSLYLTVCNVTDVGFLINFDVNELTQSSISASHCTKVVLDFILSGFKPKVKIPFRSSIFVSKLVCPIKSPIAYVYA